MTSITPCGAADASVRGAADAAVRGAAGAALARSPDHGADSRTASSAPTRPTMAWIHKSRLPSRPYLLSYYYTRLLYIKCIFNIAVPYKLIYSTSS